MDILTEMDCRLEIASLQLQLAQTQATLNERVTTKNITIKDLHQAIAKLEYYTGNLNYRPSYRPNTCTGCGASYTVYEKGELVLATYCPKCGVHA